MRICVYDIYMHIIYTLTCTMYMYMYVHIHVYTQMHVLYTCKYMLCVSVSVCDVLSNGFSDDGAGHLFLVSLWRLHHLLLLGLSLSLCCLGNHLLQNNTHTQVHAYTHNATHTQYIYMLYSYNKTHTHTLYMYTIHTTQYTIYTFYMWNNVWCNWLSWLWMCVCGQTMD